MGALLMSPEQRLQLAELLLEFRARKSPKGAAQPIEDFMDYYTRRHTALAFTWGVLAGLAIGALALLGYAIR
jgi:hypothetical protein